MMFNLHIASRQSPTAGRCVDLMAAIEIALHVPIHVHCLYYLVKTHQVAIGRHTTEFWSYSDSSGETNLGVQLDLGPF